MNLFELRTTGSWAFHLEFHPRLTVISGLREAQAARMANMIGSAMRCRLSESQLVILHDGGYRRLDEEVLSELGLDTLGFEPVFRQQELPGAQPVNEPNQLDERPAAEREADEPQLDNELRRRHELATLPVADAEGPLQPVWHRLEASWSRREFARTSTAATGDSLATRVDITALQEGLAQANAALDAFRASTHQENSGVSVDVQEAHIAALVDERQRVADELARLEAAAERHHVVPTRAVEVALQRLDAMRPSAMELPPLEAAVNIADRLADVETHITKYPRPEVPAWLRKQAEEALGAARARLVTAENESRVATVTQAQIDAVEARHVEVIAARQNEHKRIGAAGVKRRVEEALAEEAAALEVVGARSYEAYRVLLGVFGTGREAAEQHIADAQRNLLDAQQVTDELDHPDPTPAWTALLEERAATRLEAETLLGSAVEPHSLEGALRAMKGEPRGLEPQLQQLRDALVDIEESVEADDDPETIARAFLQCQNNLSSDFSQRQVQMRSLNDRVEEIEVLLVQARETLAEAESVAAALSDENKGFRAQLDQMELNVTELEAQLAAASLQNAAADAADAERHRAEVALVEAEAAYEQAKREFTYAQDSLRAERDSQSAEQRSWQAGAGFEELDLTKVDLVEADRAILARVAQQRYVGLAGSLPLICMDILSGLPGEFVRTELGLLQRLSSVVQIVYVTGDEDIISWAASLGPDFAVIRRFSGP